VDLFTWMAAPPLSIYIQSNYFTEPTEGVHDEAGLLNLAGPEMQQPQVLAPNHFLPTYINTECQSDMDRHFLHTLPAYSRQMLAHPVDS
jgi:hypothetical protein